MAGPASYNAVMPARGSRSTPVPMNVPPTVTRLPEVATAEMAASMLQAATRTPAALYRATKPDSPVPASLDVSVVVTSGLESKSTVPENEPKVIVLPSSATVSPALPTRSESVAGAVRKAQPLAPSILETGAVFVHEKLAAGRGDPTMSVASPANRIW